MKRTFLRSDVLIGALLRKSSGTFRTVNW